MRKKAWVLAGRQCLMAFRDKPLGLHPSVCVYKGMVTTAHGKVWRPCHGSLHAELRLMACISPGWRPRSPLWSCGARPGTEGSVLREH